jgi:acyl-coenzyme A synthetase/AMP-(fatty) acid ligase
MFTDFLLETFLRAASEDAIVHLDRVLSYGQLLERIDYWRDHLEEAGLGNGTVVSVEADFSPDAIALLLNLVEKACVVVPLTRSVEGNKPEFREIAEVECVLRLEDDGRLELVRTGRTAKHEILQSLREKGHPGLVLFSSGWTGKSKAAVHDFVPLLEKFKLPRNGMRTITFLLFDHIGGINTLFYSLANAGCIVTLRERTPEAVCRAIESHRVETLPTSPTFLNLLLVGRAYQRYDISSLRLVTYGTEMMPENTLKRIHEVLPNVRLLQTYGLSEVGILRSKSRSPDSLWVKVGGEDFETRVEDGLLEIRAKSAMCGYLNAPSPFTEDGWFKTGDAVEVDGEYFRFLGRRSEQINVGGEKVYPAEVEGVLQLMSNVEDAAVWGEPHPITGQIVTARVKLIVPEAANDFRRRMREFCRGRLARFKIPQRVELAESSLHGERFKKMRR